MTQWKAQLVGKNKELQLENERWEQILALTMLINVVVLF
jgi:hypothetical protein